MIIQFIVSLVATFGFAHLFAAPKKELLFCGLTGAIGWIVYLIVSESGGSIAFANVLASFALTVTARILSVLRRNPATVYLRPGIFPLVPGAGIYYTSYYFIINDTSQCVSYGIQTVIVAGSIVMGMLLGSAIPQSWFNKLQGFRPSS